MRPTWPAARPITLGPTPLPAIAGGYVVLSTEDAPGPGLPDRTALSGGNLSVGDDLLTIAKPNSTA